MKKTPVIAIFDVGKTNKKFFLFDEGYNKVFEETVQLNETVDEDGDSCENLALLIEWVTNSFGKLMGLPNFEIKAINFSAYGASFVHIMEEGKELLPLYNYLKPYPQLLQEEFYNTYGGEIKIAKETASPVAGNLNAGLQLYRIKKQQPEIYNTILRSLFLPQYLSFLITNQQFSDITSIGCHTSLWDFKKKTYHDWVYKEGIDKKLPAVKKGDEIVEVHYRQQTVIAGIGLHDSSAALIPYLINFIEPFILISTGTWCISLNPFNNTILTEEELKHDCLCYIQYQGVPVKANRLFAGYEHEQQVQKLAQYFCKPADYYKQVSYDGVIIKKLQQQTPTTIEKSLPLVIEAFDNYKEAYHQLMINIIEKQVQSTNRILAGTDVKRIFVDGGFSKNPIYMNLMAQAFPNLELFAASMAQATAMGAALAIHHKWNNYPIPGDMIELKMYTVPKG